MKEFQCQKETASCKPVKILCEEKMSVKFTVPKQIKQSTVFK